MRDVVVVFVLVIDVVLVRVSREVLVEEPDIRDEALGTELRVVVRVDVEVSVENAATAAKFLSYIITSGCTEDSANKSKTPIRRIILFCIYHFFLDYLNL